MYSVRGTESLGIPGTRHEDTEGIGEKKGEAEEGPGPRPSTHFVLKYLLVYLPTSPQGEVGVKARGLGEG